MRNPGKSLQFKRPAWLNLLGFVLAVSAAFTVRTLVYNREAAAVRQATGADFIPFTVESAMMYDYAQDCASGEGVPARDRQLIGMEDLTVGRQMSLGLEQFLGWGYRVVKMFGGDDGPGRFEDSPGFVRWARFQIRLWTSLTTGFIFLWLIFLGCRWRFALFGAFLHAVSPAAIARYTGQDLVRGEFALPFIAASFAVAYWCLRRPGRLKLIALAGLSFLAIAFWDICQIIFGLWGVMEIVRIFFGGTVNRKRGLVWLSVLCGLLLAALLVPYHQTHRLILSPTVMIVFPSLILPHFVKASGWRRLVVMAATALGLILAWRLILMIPGARFAGNYGHFAELLLAKLRYLNSKPTNPLLLSFDARVLWTPSMHSADMPLAKAFFPFGIWLFWLMLIVSAAVPRLRSAVIRGLGRSFVPVLMTAIFFISFFFIVRYHVFCALFLCVALPMLMDDWSRRRQAGGLLVFLSLLALCAVLVEGNKTRVLRRAYHAGFFQETAALIEWMRRDPVGGANVLADFGLSPLLKAYCGAGILLQPKYELGETRRNYEEFVTIMYHGDEELLNRYCLKHGIDILVFDRGYAAPGLHPYSPRYFAAAFELDKNSPVSRMFHAPGGLNWFARLHTPDRFADLNRRYTVFKAISPQDRMTAMRHAFMAEEALRGGDPIAARRLARRAYLLDPNSDDAYKAYFRAFEDLPRLFLKDIADMRRMKNAQTE